MLLFSDPPRLLAALLLLALTSWLTPSATQAQHFEECLASGENNATVVIPDTATVTLGTEDAFAAGDEIALFTEDDVCAGVGSWNSANGLSIAVWSSSGQSAGFDENETLNYRFWNASTGEELGGTVTYRPCDDNALCVDQNLFVSGGIYVVATIDATDVLPVELTDFRALLDGDSVLLTWHTASETNNAGFHVEHRTPSGPFAASGFVEGAGTTIAPQRYAFRLDELAPGTHRFRLKQIDFDGAYAYSQELELTIGMDAAFEVSPVYPNPVRNRSRLAVSVAETQHVQVALYNVLGQRVATLFDNVIAGGEARPPLTVEAGSLPSGLYLVRIQGEHFTATRRIALVN